MKTLTFVLPADLAEAAARGCWVALQSLQTQYGRDPEYADRLARLHGCEGGFGGELVKLDTVTDILSRRVEQHYREEADSATPEAGEIASG